ncbi:response regulator, partial [Pseudomonas sp. Pseusp97]|uniref:response regulator n=1 Tax=Pseudomonas sp. Pseusp97 TaxID=3243065 RepID=UPI0039A76BD1
MRIGIVNDMPLAVEAMRRALAFEPAHRVVWVAANGAEAIEMCAAHKPDVVLMDLLMPVMDGVEATRRIMAQSPCAIIVVTVDLERNMSRVFDAMGNGAVDAVNTPVMGSGDPAEAARPLLRKLQNLAWLNAPQDSRPVASAPLVR